jgi:predicted ATPase
MKFHIEKLGCIDKADIELGDLTILCGDNNTGKTYVSYAIYGFLKYLRDKADFKIDRDIINKLLKDGILKIDLKIFEKQLSEVVNNLCQKYKRFIPRVFSAGEDYFSESIFTASINEYYFDYEKKLAQIFL